MGDSFVIDGLAGEKRLTGTIAVGGSKNALLSVMAAAMLVDGESHFENVPHIADLESMSRLLEGLGAYATHRGNTLSINAKELTSAVFEQSAAKSLRASILLVGPVLARLHHVSFPHPGGDVIGERPIDIFLSAFEKLGATCTQTADTYSISAQNGLSGGTIFFRMVSVTATETLMMAATAANGPVILKNCAVEPEVVATAEFLKLCGASIEGAGTPTIHIRPSSLMPPSSAFRIIPDRIEAASFLALGALAARDLTVTNLDISHLDAVLDVLERMGVPFSTSKDAVRVEAPDYLHPVRLRTHEYPGFPTDAQAPTMVLLTQAEGESDVIESVFDGRLNYTSELVRMGANITLVSPHRANIRGKTPLHAANIESPDLRAGLAFVLAAILAEGTSKVGGAHLVDRGYEAIEKRLSDVGVSIRRA
ncbi:UDP-N-acetylglucosamine 1-carboxyvinyltransferase [Candidatus Kaiserbacteria bacterium RIFCSPHIGHO2_01_FULL_48_10]|uniref:UDP-N-acetylglucosamine 1-carboxyvinyltransferase n=1 Tax=Candidatus Kaiserbacteria bacterium RIFCSPHIGHO2_01_FULL_48_10 TaxID=1798476 RepID=A0A1F6C535_9BACT|nr:MAG: UDP-N-acetylglucosamine 1-carboxyvinyltransferase [Candidatus Kaiserbacteria bacterium RIFCSPHIGHO2_01_FULL_48_10]